MGIIRFVSLIFCDTFTIMTIDFPNNPVMNQSYSFSGKHWKWNGYAWESIATPFVLPPLSSSDIEDFVPAVNEAITEVDAGAF